MFLLYSTQPSPAYQKINKTRGAKKKKKAKGKKTEATSTLSLCKPSLYDASVHAFTKTTSPLHSSLLPFPLFSSPKRTDILTSIITSQQHNMPCHAAYRINACRGVRGVDLTCSDRVGGPCRTVLVGSKSSKWIGQDGKRGCARMSGSMRHPFFA